MQDKNPNSLFGADLNEYSQNVNFGILATSVDFLYLRSSGSGSGRFRPDRKFIEFAKGARNYGIPVGAYHYALPSADITSADIQCDDFIKILQEGFGQGNYGDIYPVVDVEAPVDKSITTVQLLSWIDRFRKRFEEKTRRRLMLYTGAFFIDIYDNFYYPGRGFILSNMPLWIAMYPSIPGNPPYPKNQGGWERWKIWQFTESGKVNGVSSPSDLNWGPDSLDLLKQPQRVSGLNATRNGNIIDVTWDKPSNADISGYNLYLNDAYAGTAGKNATSYKIDINKYKMIPKGMPLRVSIEAFDLDNEFSTERASITLPQPREDTE